MKKPSISRSILMVKIKSIYIYLQHRSTTIANEIPDKQIISF